MPTTCKIGEWDMINCHRLILFLVHIKNKKSVSLSRILRTTVGLGIILFGMSCSSLFQIKHEQPIQYSISPDASINVLYEKSIDLTDDNVNEQIMIRAGGEDLKDLVVLFEIRDTDNHLLYASAWLNRDWLLNKAPGPQNESDEEKLERMLQYVINSVHPYTSQRPLNEQMIRLALIDQYWREENQYPPHRHLSGERFSGDIERKYQKFVSDQQLYSALAALVQQPRFSYTPTLEATIDLSWFPPEHRFLIIGFTSRHIIYR